jgi:hypothetical protein
MFVSLLLVLLAERILTLCDDQELVSLIFSYSYELNKLSSDDYIVLFPRYWIQIRAKIRLAASLL